MIKIFIFILILLSTLYADLSENSNESINMIDYKLEKATSSAELEEAKGIKKSLIYSLPLIHKQFEAIIKYKTNDFDGDLSKYYTEHNLQAFGASKLWGEIIPLYYNNEIAKGELLLKKIFIDKVGKCEDYSYCLSTITRDEIKEHLLSKRGVSDFIANKKEFLKPLHFELSIEFKNNYSSKVYDMQGKIFDVVNYEKLKGELSKLQKDYADEIIDVFFDKSNVNIENDSPFEFYKKDNNGTYYISYTNKEHDVFIGGLINYDYENDSISILDTDVSNETKDKVLNLSVNNIYIR
jgi:hypothetical protein